LVLERVNEPHDLGGLNRKELEQLAAEIRSKIIDTVNVTGGHLASSLGAVELAIALHRVFDSPRDKIVWDVGHQAYAHKLLTGRRDRFNTLRQYGGLSGFPDRDESPYDSFTAGHASTSISAALGMAKARDATGGNYSVVAVTGDGSLTGGMSFEALNHAGHLRARLIVVLNDNGMAIAPSVGALSRLLSRLTIDRRYYWAEEEASHVVPKIPLGRKLWRMWGKISKGVKGLVIPSMFWDELGFTYTGPINGHDIAALEKALYQAKDYTRRPILVHVVTTKGKGYESAEDDAVGFHGVSPKSGAKGSTPSYSEVFGRAVLRLMRENPNVIAVTAAMSEGTGLDIAADEFPQRVFDVGICEQHAVTFAAGMATQGFIPIVAVYSTFLQRSLDQIIHDVCLQNIPVIFAIDRAGIVGEDGKTHQGSFDLSYLSFIPNIVVASPKDENELQHLMYTAVKSGRPFAIRYPRGTGTGISLDEDLREIPVGKGEVLHKGEDVVILAIGSCVTPSMEAARKLDNKSVKCTIVNARYIKPLDSTLILDVARSNKRVITVEENAVLGGFGSAVAELLESSSIDRLRLRHIGLPDEFVPHGPQAVLRSKYNLDAHGIAQQTLSAFPELVSLMNAHS
jgi:1-deoxy-D-xylulose-5-phosphate synthase